MNRSRVLSFIIVLLLVNVLPGIQAQNWPGWRGPFGDGTSKETNLPVRWDSKTNVLWRSAVPGLGYSSPVVWEDRLFITTAVNETQEKMLLCYDSHSGDLLWQRTVIQSPFERKHSNNGYASGTPATDGELVYVSFLDGRNAVVAAYDFAGKQVWIQRPGIFSSQHGYSCSPVLFGDKVIINGNSQQGESFFAALSKADGQIIWKIPHPRRAHNFSTPIFREINGTMQMIFCGNKEIASYNPDDGSKYWSVDNPSEEFCSSPVYSEMSGLVIASSSYPQRILLAIKSGGRGDVTASHVVWRSREGGVYVPSPISIDNYLFTTMTNGQVHCIDVATGKILWKQNHGAQYSSPVQADGLVYMPNDKGVITVIKPGPTFNSIAENSIGERMYASPAISNGRIYLRGFQNLYCIGNADSR
jgi:outer membrane protein assembly factor BamB